MLFRALFQRSLSASEYSILNLEYDGLDVKVLRAIGEIGLKGDIKGLNLQSEHEHSVVSRDEGGEGRV